MFRGRAGGKRGRSLRLSEMSGIVWRRRVQEGESGARQGDGRSLQKVGLNEVRRRRER